MKIKQKTLRGNGIQVFILLILGLLIVGCSPQQSNKQTIDVSEKIQNCRVYAAKVECDLTDGNTYYVSTFKINMNTKWYPETWKENVAYCPKNTTIINITDQCNYEKYCKDGEKWIACI